MKRRGVTLIEVMVGIVLSSLVLGAAYHIWTYSRRDFLTGNSKQILQSEVRTALDFMANDFKAILAGSLKVTSGADGNSAKISFKRFSKKEEAGKTQIDSKSVIEVVYDFNRPRLTRKAGPTPPRFLGFNIEKMDISQGQSDATLVPQGMEKVAGARLDIAITGRMMVPMVGKWIEHTEKTSVFMNSEYQMAQNKGVKSVAELSATDSSKISAATFLNDAMLSAGSLSPEALAGLTSAQLQDLLAKEQSSKTEADKKMKSVNDQLEGVDARGGRTLNPMTWLSGSPTDVSEIQEKLKKDNSVADLKADTGKLKKITDQYENDFINKSLGGKMTYDGGRAGESEAQRKEREAVKEAFDLMAKDRNIQKAAEENPQKDANGNPIPYKSLMENFNTSNMQKGVDVNGNPFNETDDQYKSRKDHADAVFQASQKMDLSWMDNEKESVKIYSAAKDLTDLAVAKTAYAENRDLSQSNIEAIQEAMGRK